MISCMGKDGPPEEPIERDIMSWLKIEHNMRAYRDHVKPIKNVSNRYEYQIAVKLVDSNISSRAYLNLIRKILPPKIEKYLIPQFTLPIEEVSVYADYSSDSAGRGYAQFHLQYKVVYNKSKYKLILCEKDGWNSDSNTIDSNVVVGNAPN